MDPYTIFQFMRGAIRSRFGSEELRGKTILMVGMNSQAQDLLHRFCIDGFKIRFSDQNLTNCVHTISICQNADFYLDEGVDIILDIKRDTLLVRDKVCKISSINKEDPYNDGIHTFYIQDK